MSKKGKRSKWVESYRLLKSELPDDLAVQLADDLQLASVSQAREFFGILWNRYGDTWFTEKQFEEELGAYVVTLSLFRQRLGGWVTFEVIDPLDLDEERQIVLLPVQNQSLSGLDDLTLAEMNGRWLLVGARAAR